MHRPGHYGAALVAYAPVAFLVALVAGVLPALYGAGVAVALSMVPDLDQRLPFVQHRGATHTVWFALGVAFLIAGISMGVLSPLTGAFVGLVAGLSLLSHVAADAITPAGVSPWEPLDSRRYSGDTLSASLVANYGLALVGGVALLVALGVAVRV